LPQFTVTQLQSLVYSFSQQISLLLDVHSVSWYLWWYDGVLSTSQP